jgi:hypothetical protein
MSATIASDSTPSAGEVATAAGRAYVLGEYVAAAGLPIGCFVSLTDDQGVIRLAQVESHQLGPDGQMQATGRMLGILDANGLDSSATPALGSATVAAAQPEMITRLNTGAGATLDIGSMSSRSELPARLLARRLNRHTFWCGQSGSGKTYALGVLLEEVLLQTELPLIIFDPNGDFVRLTDVREDALPNVPSNCGSARSGCFGRKASRVRISGFVSQISNCLPRPR